MRSLLNPITRKLQKEIKLKNILLALFFSGLFCGISAFGSFDAFPPASHLRFTSTSLQQDHSLISYSLRNIYTGTLSDGTPVSCKWVSVNPITQASLDAGFIADGDQTYSVKPGAKVVGEYVRRNAILPQCTRSFTTIQDASCWRGDEGNAICQTQEICTERKEGPTKFQITRTLSLENTTIVFSCVTAAVFNKDISIDDQTIINLLAQKNTSFSHQ
jgi:hypothetical protein